MKRTTIYLDEIVLNKLKKYSFENKMTMTDTIRIAIKKFFESEKEINAGMDYKDIIGIAEGPYKDNVSEKVEEYLMERFKK